MATPPPPPAPPTPSADLTISSLTQSINPQSVNGSVTYTIKVRNAGTSNLTNVRAHWYGAWGGWTQPFEGSFSADSGFQCYVPLEYYNQDVRCVGGSLQAGQTATITVTAKGPSAPGTYNVQATADPYTEIAPRLTSRITSSR
jgi:hypothetical protein